MKTKSIDNLRRPESAPSALLMKRGILATVATTKTLFLSIWLLLLLIPVIAYGIAILLAVLHEGSLAFGRLDVAVLFLVIVYLCAGILIDSFHNKRRALLFLASVYSMLVTLAVVEVVLRAEFPPFPSALPRPPMHTVSIAGDKMPGISGTIEFTINRMGLRGPEVQLGEVDLRILCLGGSSTESLYVTDKLSWPWLLQDKLAENLKKRVFVGNAGKSGHLTVHLDYLLNHYPLAKHFEWAIVMVALNDLGTLVARHNYEHRLQNVAEESLTPTYANQVHYRRLALVQLASRALWGVWHGHANEVVVNQDPQGEWYTAYRQQRQKALKTRTMRELPPDFDKALATYRGNLEKLVWTTRRLRQRLVLMTEPTMYRKDLPPHLELLLFQHSNDGAYSTAILERMMSAFNKTVIDVAREQGVDYIDLASMLPKDTSVFYDDVHFNISGSKMVATIVADFFTRKLRATAH